MQGRVALPFLLQSPAWEGYPGLGEVQDWDGDVVGTYLSSDLSKVLKTLFPAISLFQILNLKGKLDVTFNM